MIKVFEIHKIKESKTNAGYSYEIDGRVLEVLAIENIVYSTSNPISKLTIKKIITYGKEVDNILPPMGGKLIVNSDTEVVFEKYLGRVVYQS